MPYYIENDLLYQQQMTLDGDSEYLYIPRALVYDIFK